MNNHNPDVLSCLANLSNDEVFTPPVLANKVLDLLPPKVWQNKDTRFLDPVSKSGVFLREITRRLISGLEKEIPDVQSRIDHIYSKQVFGISITELTSLLSRRTLYCSKSANGKYSVAGNFLNDQGNITYKRVEHTWANGNCVHCGATKSVYDRGKNLESYAYPFIHTKLNSKSMKFDVIVGNPPFQLSDGGAGASAKPLYHRFVQQAIKLSPSFLSMIIPARWFSGGRGVDEFRDEMLNDRNLRIIHDFPNASDCFPGIEIKGGVCYFLWQKGNGEKCTIHTHQGDRIVSSAQRDLLEKGADTFIRLNEAIPILRKVQKVNEKTFATLISPNDPFGYDVRVEGSFKRIMPKYQMKSFKNSILFYYSGWQQGGIGHIEKSTVTKNIEWINQHKVYITKAYGAGESYPHQIINVPILGKPNSCCSESYIVVGPFANEKLALNVISYMKTKFFRFLVSLKKITQEARRGVYQFVPMQNFNQSWSDAKLYQKYGVSQKEQLFIDSIIRPMDIKDEE